MALFVRPAAWNYDQELFRRATDDDDRLEAMLAATVIEEQGLWVVESNERPIAFAWTQIEQPAVRAVALYVDADEAPNEPLRLLLTRIEQEYAGKASRLEVAPETVSGVGSDTLEAVGLTCEADVWIRTLAPRGA